MAERRLPFTGLSARLLFLTIFFVMLIEVFVYAPSIGRYRNVYLQDRIDAAYIASLALQSPADRRADPELMKELLRSSQSYAIVLRRPDSKTLMQIRDDMPPKVDATLRRSRNGFADSDRGGSGRVVARRAAHDSGDGPVGRAIPIRSSKP